MENINGKADFLKNDYIDVLTNFEENPPRKWGKMTFQQMVEHMVDYVCIASGKTKLEVVATTERLPQMFAFLESEKPFRENTPNSLMSETPTPVKYPSLGEAILQLKSELNFFFHVYETQPLKIEMNPFFGHLDFEHQVQLLHKHAIHHLRQFGFI